MEDEAKTAKEAVSAIGEIIKIAGENPNAKAAASDLAKAAHTVTTALNVVLLPLAAVNFAYKKAHVYFHERFPQDLKDATASIPPEDLIEPKASLAGPALQGLAFSHEEEDLKQLYINLLRTAMDSRSASTAHPSFVEIIKQLSCEEAQLLKDALGYERLTAIAEITVKGPLGFYNTAKHMIDLRNEAGQIVENPSLPMMIDNWSRLRLVPVDYGVWLTGPSAYEWVPHRPEYIRAHATRDGQNVQISFRKGSMQRTDYGSKFAEAVGIIP